MPRPALALLLAAAAVAGAIATCAAPPEPATEPDLGHTASRRPADAQDAPRAAVGAHDRAAPRRTPRHPRAAEDRARPPVEATAFLPPVPLVSGVVRMSDGTPVARAFVALGDLDRACETALTDAGGRFGFEVWASYTAVSAVALRDGAVWRGRVPADGPEQNLTVTLAPAPPGEGAVFVHVTDPRGADVPRAEVRRVAGPLRVTDARLLGNGDLADRTAVAAGWFAIPVRPLLELLRRDEVPSVFLVSEPSAACGRPLPWGPALVTIPPGASGTVEVRLPDGASLSGHVVLPDGRPARNARVHLVPPPPEGFDAATMTNPSRGDRTDERGRFEFTGLAPGSGTLSVLPGFDASSALTGVVPPDVHAGAAPREVRTGQDDVPVTVRPLVTTEIVVADALGRLVEGADVRVEGDERWVLANAVTGPEGSCDFADLPSGAVLDVTVIPGEVALGLAAARARPVAIDGTFRVVLPPAVSLHGRVVAPDGASLPQIPVTVERADGLPATAVSGDPFVVHGLAAGTRVALSIQDASGRRVASAGATAGDEVLLRWPDEEDRLTLVLPVKRPEFDVLLRIDGRAEASVRPAGPVVTFESGRLPARVDVQVGPTPDGEFTWLPQTPARGFHRIDLRSGVTLRGRVVVEGTDVPGILECTVRTSGEFEGFSHDFKTIWDGTFEVRGLPSGRGVVEVRLPDGPSVRASVELPEAEDVVLTVGGN